MNMQHREAGDAFCVLCGVPLGYGMDLVCQLHAAQVMNRVLNKA